MGVINSDEEGDGAELAGSQEYKNNMELPEELDSMEAREFGERLCEGTASDWSAAKLKDDTARTAVDFILAGVAVGDTTNEVMPGTVDKLELKRVLSQGELMELPNSRKMLVNVFPRNLHVAMTRSPDGLNDCGGKSL